MTGDGKDHVAALQPRIGRGAACGHGADGDPLDRPTAAGR